jgi:autotransporter-associated beta strand protein
MKPKSTLRTFLALAGSSLLAISPAHAATLTWDHNADGTASDGGGTWLDANKWLDGVTPATWNNGTPDNAVIGSGGTGGTITLGTVTAGTVLLDNFTGTYTLSGGSLAQSGGITVGATAGAVTINSLISSAGGISKAGSSTMIITNTGNAYTGKTLVTGGVLQIGNGWSNSWASGTLSAGSNLEINGGTVSVYYYGSRSLGAGAGQIQFTGGRGGISNKQGDAGGAIWTANASAAYEVVWGALGEGAATGFFNPSTFVLNDGAASPAQVVYIPNKFDLNGADRTFESSSAAWGGRLNGVIRNSGASPAGIIKVGVGTLQLEGANTYDGGTSIDQGTVDFNSLVSMPAAGTVEVKDAATLRIGLGGGGQWTTGTSGNGTLGGLLAGLGGQSGGTVSYAGNVTVGVRVSGSQIYSGVLADVGSSLSLGTAGTGTLELSGDNTLTGNFLVEGGSRLILSGDNSAAPGSPTIINGYLQAAQAVNLPGGVLTLASTGNNPAIHVTNGTLSPVIGSGDDVFWSGNGGFAASNSPLTVTLNGGATVDWGSSTGFNGKVLQLGSPTSTSTVEITNDITIENNRTILLFNNTSSRADVSILSGDIVSNSGNRNLYFQGSGTVVLSGNNDVAPDNS